MGSLDSAEASDLVGLFLLYNLSAFDCLDSDSVGLYRDDGLLVVRNSTKIKVDRIRKMIHKVFKDLGLRVIVSTNVKRVDFLDVTLDLTSNTYQPYVKLIPIKYTFIQILTTPLQSSNTYPILLNVGSVTTLQTVIFLISIVTFTIPHLKIVDIKILILNIKAL